MVSSSFRGAPRVKLLCALVASCFAAEGLANPTGPAVAAGAASFNTIGKALTVTNSPNAIINWQGFSIGAGEITRFQQQGASSAVLNRVVGQDPSAILGTLWSNGKVFLVNPNGVLFGQGSRIDVAGLVASTLNITDRDFLAGRLNFQAGAVAGSIINQGEIVSASGGRIFLIAPDIQNHGLISSPSGEVVLAAGKTVSLVDADVPNLKVEVQAGGEALNVGKILAEGGKAGIYAGLINQRGIVRADSVSKDATGKIVFKASDTTILDEGSLTSAAGAKGGEIQVLGNKVGLVGNARVDASGDAGGGTVLIGGDFQGKNAEVQNAWRTYVGPQSSIAADAITTGDGGKVIVWADDATRAYGTISARGGAHGGNGGFVEVSGRNWLDFQARVNTGALTGAAGTLLLDPSDVDIVSGADTLSGGGAGFNGGTPDNIFSGGTGASSISWTTIKTHLTTTNGGTNVTITTSPNSGGQCSTPGTCGDIDIINGSPDLTSANTLRLLAHRHINVTGGGITNSGGGAVEMWAGWDGVTATPGFGFTGGTITLAQPINLSGVVKGDLRLYAYSGITDTAGAIITAGNLLAVTDTQPTRSVDLSANSHMVDVIAGRATEHFKFKNAQALTIGSLAGFNGIAVNAIDGSSLANVNVQVTGSGNLTVSNSINATGSTTAGTGTVTLVTAAGDIVANPGVSITASGGNTGFGSAGAASVSLQSSNLVTLNGANVTATGGNSTDSAGGGGSADVLVQAGGSISVSGSSTIIATGGTAPSVGGNASVTLQTTNPGAAISVADSEVSALFSSSGNALSTVTMTATGALSISGNSPIEAYSGQNAQVNITAGGNLSVGGSASPVLEARSNSTVSLLLQSTSGDIEMGGNILADAGISGTAFPTLSAPAGAITSIGGGILQSPSSGAEFVLSAQKGIGTVANPIRVDSANIQVFATNAGAAPTGDVAISFVNGDVTLVPFGLQTLLRNDSLTGTYFLQAETGNILLSTAFHPNNAALIAGQGASLKALAGNITVDPAGSIAATGAGGITLFADNRAGSGPTPDGVLISGGQLSADTGTISITGYGLLGAAACGGCRIGGVTLNNGAAVQTNTGGISITGFGGSFLSGVPLGGEQYGILMSGGLAGSTISTTGGAITLTGTGGSLSNESGSTDVAITRGVRATGVIQATGSGSIDITGFGGTLTGTNQVGLTGGVQLIGNVTSVNGNIHVTGSGGSTGTQVDLTTGSRGVVTSGLVESTGSGSITITGNGGTSSSADGNIGVFLGSVVRTNSGSITIQGTGGNSSVSGATNPGVLTQSALTVQSTGGGSIAINGAGGTSGATPQDGISLTGGGSAISISTVGASLGLTATVGGLKIGDPLDGAQSVSISSGSGPLTISAAGDMTFNPVGGSISVSGGTVLMSAGGNLSLPTGTSVSGTDVTLLANDMDIVGAVTGTNSATLAASNLTQNIDIGSLGLGGGPLSIGSSEINNVTAPTITIGRSDSTSNILYLDEALTSGNVHATNLKLRAFDIYENGAGGINGPYNVDLIAGRNITLAVNSIVLGDNRNLSILADNANQSGTLNIGGVNLVVGSGTNTTGSMTLTGHDINAIVSGGGSGNIRVFGTGNQTITATGIATFQNNNPSTGTLLVRDDGGMQTISVGGLQVIAGSGTNTSAQIIAGGSQSIAVDGGGLTVTGGNGTAASASAAILQNGSSGTQTITSSGGGNITLTGGSGSGNTNFARIRGSGTAQSFTFSGGGNLVLQGGTVGNFNFSDLRADNATTGAQTQTISGATGISLTGGASGGGVDPVTNNGLGNFAQIRIFEGSQSISAGSGGISMMGGGGSLTNNFALIIQGSNTVGSPATSQTITISNGGAMTLQGGSTAQTNVINNPPNNFFRGSYSLIEANGDSQTIQFPGGGAITLTGGTVGSNNPAQIFSRFGLQTISGAPAIALHGGTGGYVDIANNKNEGNFARITGNGGQTITASSITMNGGDSGVGNHAQIFNGSTTAAQSIGATSVSLTGGLGGGIDSGSTGQSMSNFALIQSNGPQTINASSMLLQGGAGGTENFAAVIAPSQTISLLNDLTLTGGASASGAVRGGGSRVGGAGGGTPGPTALELNVGGNVHLTGGSAANAGTAIGSGQLGGQPTTITMDVGGNVTLDPGSASGAGSRIGSPSSNIAGGDISITAGGTLALNSTGPGLGTAIRTLGNVTLNAAAITQGADSEIISGGTTTITGGTVSLPSATNQFGTVLLATTGNVTITDADAINFGTSTTGSGSLTATAPGGITQSGPITTGAATFHAGASPIVLTNSGNDFTGPVDLDTSSSAQITDANTFIIKGGGGGGPNPTSLTINANGAVTQSAAFTGSAPAAIVINAGSGPITLNNASNNFTGNTSVAANTTGAVSLTNGNASGINLGASTVGGALSLTSGGPVTQSGPITVAGASTINAGSNAITLTNGSNDFVGALNFTGSNVSITDVNAIAIGNSNASGTLNIVATSTSFLNGFSANNYSFSGGTYALAAGTYNLGGTTSMAQNPVTGALTTVDVQSGATINTLGGTVNVGAGGTLSGTGTIQGNVNNIAGTVSPGASPGMLTITGNYTQGASGVLDMQIGGPVAGTDYDQLRVGGTTSLAGTLNTALINGFVPVSGQTFTLVQSTGPISGTFTTTNQPAGTLFNSFYGPTTVDFIAASTAAVPPQLVPVVQNTIVSVEQVLVSLAPTTTTTNSETGLLLVTGIDVAPATEARDESKAAAGSDKKEEKSVAKKTFCN